LIFQAFQPSFRNRVLSAKHGFNRKPHCNGISSSSGKARLKPEHWTQEMEDGMSNDGHEDDPL
jgi:hypothetical protein